MKITVVGRHMTVKDYLKEQLEKKISKFDKFFSDNTECTATFSRKRNLDNLEITIVSDGTFYRSEVEDETFINAIDKGVETLESQIRRNKTRLQKRLREDAFKQLASPEYDYHDDIEEEDKFDIRTKSFPIKPMDAEEAILQMNLLGHQFFVFTDIATHDTCVVYKRKDGAYGLIVPER